VDGVVLHRQRPHPAKGSTTVSLTDFTIDPVTRSSTATSRAVPAANVPLLQLNGEPSRSPRRGAVHLDGHCEPDPDGCHCLNQAFATRLQAGMPLGPPTSPQPE